jgi:methionyl-tRNA formyltransferase
MKIVLWIGNESNQVALAHKLSAKYEVVGVVVESKKTIRKYSIKKITEKIYEKIWLKDIDEAWFGMKTYYHQQYAGLPETDILSVENINAEEVADFSIVKGAELIVVSGTRLIRKKQIDHINGIPLLNLHTGLSPYIKGGPNCTNWCISTGQFHLIGNTMMWLDAGIDSGNIIVTELSDFIGTENLGAVHLKVMEHAHDLCIRAVASVINKNAPNVQQDSIAKGNTYYNKDWKLSDKKGLIRNFKKWNAIIHSEEYLHQKKETITVSL